MNFLFFILLYFVGAISATQDTNTLSTLKDNSNLSLFVQAIELANDTILLQDLSNCNNNTLLQMTIFAPTNRAVQSSYLMNLIEINANISARSNETQGAMMASILYHIIPELVPSQSIFTDIPPGTSRPALTLLGSNLTIIVPGINQIQLGPDVFNRTASVVEPNIRSCSAVIHTIDGYLVPVFLNNS